MVKECLRCGAGVRAGGRGMPQKYCSAACKQAAWRERKEANWHVPEGLASVPRWVCVRLFDRGGGRTGKRPIMPDGSPASVSDAGTWSSFEECWGRQDGAGFVLGGGVACVDLDDCFVSGGGLSDVAVGVLGLCEGAFVERSWSGRGLHVWGVCSERVGRVCAGYECYSRGRFIMVTGRVFSRGGLGVDLSRFWG
jgi:primase-polymerase (primpol)-like protein